MVREQEEGRKGKREREGDEGKERKGGEIPGETELDVCATSRPSDGPLEDARRRG